MDVCACVLRRLKPRSRWLNSPFTHILLWELGRYGHCIYLVQCIEVERATYSIPSLNLLLPDEKPLCDNSNTESEDLYLKFWKPKFSVNSMLQQTNIKQVGIYKTPQNTNTITHYPFRCQLICILKLPLNLRVIDLETCYCEDFAYRKVCLINFTMTVSVWLHACSTYYNFAAKVDVSVVWLSLWA